MTFPFTAWCRFYVAPGTVAHTDTRVLVIGTQDKKQRYLIEAITPLLVRAGRVVRTVPTGAQVWVAADLIRFTKTVSAASPRRS